MRSPTRCLLLALLTAGIVVTSSSAMAAPTAPTPAQRETARRLMDEGKERTKAGELPRALEAYAKAHDLMHVPTTGLALVRAHLALDHLVEARDVALEIVRMPHEAGEPPVFTEARTKAKELEASLKPRIPTVRIVVRGGSATNVMIDDVGVAPLLLGEPVAINPGKHVIVAKNADGIEKRVEVEVAEKDAKEVELALAPSRAGAGEGEAPTGQKADPNETAGGRTTTADVLIFGGFGLAAAGLVVGGVTGAMTLSKADSVKPQCASGVCDPAAKSDLDSANSLSTISTIGFVAAGIGAACGVVGLLLPKTVQEHVALDPKKTTVWLGPGSAGVRGTF